MTVSFKLSEAAATAIEQAAARPTHAYLVVGPRGVGALDATRSLAARLIDPEQPSYVLDRVARGRHPDVIEFEPEGVTYKLAEEVREGIIAEANRSPLESDRKVVIVLDAERLRDDAMNALLKTIEEPPARTVMMLVTPAPDDLLETVRSRCRRIDLPSLSDDAIEQMLVHSGHDHASAARASRLAGGRIDRAFGFAGGTLANVRLAFVEALGSLDGRAAAAVRAAEGLSLALDDAVSALEAEHATELAALETEIEGAAYPPRTAAAMRKRLTDRHKRAQRRSRIDFLMEGLAAIESVHRDALVGPQGPLRNVDRASRRADSAAAGLDACAAARRAMEHNPNERLLLERLLLHQGSS